MYNVIDLFSGVGGLSLGAVKAGFSLDGAVELDKTAVEAHAINFPNVKHLNEDILTLDGPTLMNKLNLNSVTGIIGGPPCQGFSTIGKQNVEDSRNKLFIHFFKLVSEIKPLFFLAENVKGILNPKYLPILKSAYDYVHKDYHFFEPLVLNPKDFGGVTSRPRVFFLSFRKDLAVKDFKIIPPVDQQQYFVRDALAGLDGNHLFSEQENKENNAWAPLLPVYNLYLSTISEKVNKVGNADALKKFDSGKVSGMVETLHTDSVISRFSKITPGGVDKVSRAPRLSLDSYCPTLRAGTGKDKGSYQAIRPIHPIYNRVITVREAARLQGFPDWFQFHHTKWQSFRLIGNSVSPVLSSYILTKVGTTLFNL